MEQIRAFIAVELPPNAREVLRGIIEDLQVIAPEGVRWVKPEGVHLSLKFLGNIEVECICAIAQVISRCATWVAPFELSLGELGAFPDLKAPRAVWLGLAGALDGLLDLQRGLEDEIENLGYTRQLRSFNPHLTLGRVRETMPSTQRRGIGENLAEVLINMELELPIKEISLFQSDLKPSGAMYTRLFSASLGLLKE